MSDKPEPTRAHRATARAAIAAFAVMAVVVMLFPNTSFGAIFDLQQSGSPTGSQTGAPSGSPTGTGPAIQFLNPSTHSDVVSAKDDGTNTTYHLVAAGRAVPANPLVEFKIQEGDANETSIGIASRVGTTDTFELQWNPGALADGGYTLKVIMYNGTIELGRDEQDISVNNEDSLDDPHAEAVEIVNPTTADELGWYHSQGDPSAHAVISATASAGAGGLSGSTGTDSIVAYYSKTAIGNDTEFIECGSEGPADEGPTHIRCDLEEGDAPDAVTAVAAVAAPILPLIGGSGDAHRIFPYLQTPTTVQLAPASQGGKAPEACADPVTATVLDQAMAPVAGVNTDIHAKGPSDDTLFDVVNHSESQPPDKAHTGDPEEAWDCDAGEAAGEQAEHELPPGDSDVKHIESVDGTDNAGTFVFQLFSARGPGRTEYAVFIDEDDDDEWCATEVDGRGSIDWGAGGSPAPAPSGSASGSPSGSPSGGASGSPTGGGGAGLSELGPQKQVCPRATGSPTPPTANRDITITASDRKVKAFRRVTLSGRITAEDASCKDDELVEIRRRIHGTTAFRSFKTTATDGRGRYSVGARVKKSADYQAMTPPAGECDETASGNVSVRVRVIVSIAESGDSTPAAGERIVIAGKVRPQHDGTRVLLQRKEGKRWIKVEADKLNKKSRFRFALPANWDEVRVLRVVWPKQHKDHIQGKSRTLRYAAT